MPASSSESGNKSRRRRPITDPPFGLRNRSHVDAAHSRLSSAQAQQFGHKLGCHGLTTGQPRPKSHRMGAQQDVLHGSSHSHHAFEFRNTRRVGSEASNNNDQQGCSVCLLPCSFDLRKTGSRIPHHQCPCKHLGQTVTFFVRNNDEPPRHQPPMIGRCSGHLEELRQLVFAGPRRHQAPGRGGGTGRDQPIGKLSQLCVGRASALPFDCFC